MNPFGFQCWFGSILNDFESFFEFYHSYVSLVFTTDLQTNTD